MKKTLLTIATLLFAYNLSQAQDFRLGIKVGANFAELKTNKDFFESENSAGYQAGIWGRIGGNKFHFQPEVYFTSKNASIHPTAGDAASDLVKGDIKFSNIDVPLLLGTKFPIGPIKAKLQAGPLFSFVIDENNPYKDNVSAAYDDALNNYKDRFSALLFGTGFDFGKLAVDLRYEYGLGNISKYEGVKQSLNLWSLSVGYSLF